MEPIETEHIDYGRNWHKMREVVRERDDYQCQECGMSEENHLAEYDTQLDVHHIIPIKEFESWEEANYEENLVSVCRPCHVRTEKRNRE